MTTSGIYEIKNIKNGRRYIGSSINMQSRKRNHFSLLRRGKHHSIHLQRAFNLDGGDVFKFTVIEEVPDHSQLIEREQYWLELLKPAYNISPNAANTLGRRLSEATKQKMREYQNRPEVLQANRDRSLGSKRSPEVRAKIGAGLTGRPMSEKTRIALLHSRPGGKPGVPQGPKSAETKRKISAGLKGKKPSPETLEKKRVAMTGKKLPETHHQNIKDVWAKRTPEEIQAIVQKRKATREAKKLQLAQETLIHERIVQN